MAKAGYIFLLKALTSLSFCVVISCSPVSVIYFPSSFQAFFPCLSPGSGQSHLPLWLSSGSYVCPNSNFWQRISISLLDINMCWWWHHCLKDSKSLILEIFFQISIVLSLLHFTFSVWNFKSLSLMAGPSNFLFCSISQFLLPVSLFSRFLNLILHIFFHFCYYIIHV